MDRRLLVVACIMTRACRNRAGKGKERLFPRKIIDDRARTTYMHMYTLRGAVRPLADEGCEASKGENRDVEKETERERREENELEPHNTSLAMLVDPRYSIETEHYSFIVSPLHPLCIPVRWRTRISSASCDTCNALSNDTLTRTRCVWKPTQHTIDYGFDAS